MAFDKAKTLRSAEKYLEMGKISSAIKEYCQIVAVDPDDFTTLNMLGDLYTRVGNPTEAVGCFRRIAEHYREQGFGLKAIAMFRKIDRLRPNDLEIASNLADLYAQQDLVVEARAHYLSLVEAHSKSGATQKALEVLRKIADLDPNNTHIRTRLADGYLKQGMNAEAASCFAEAGQSLVARGAYEEAVDVFNKALQLNPTDKPSLKGLLAAHSALGIADEAAELIEKASRENPEDVELLTMLATAYLDADEPNQAERVTAMLIAKDASAYLCFVDIARLYLRHDRIAEAVRVVTSITEQMLAEREQEQLLGLIEELLHGDADNVQALRLLVRAHWWLRDMDNLKASLERLADAAQAAGLEADERYALTHLTRLDPENEQHSARLTELGGAEESAANEDLPRFDPSSEAATLTTTDSEEYMMPLTATAGEEFVLNSEELAEPVDEAGFEWNPAAEISGNGDGHDAEAAVERGFNFDSIVAEELPSGQVAYSEGETDGSRIDAMRRQELESVDFYIAQGYVDIANDTLNLLERQSGSHPEIALRREQIRNLTSGGSPGTFDTAVITESGVVFQAPPAEPPVAAEESAMFVLNEGDVETELGTGIDPGLAEIFEEYRASSEGDNTANGDYETHYNLGLAYKEMDLFEDALEEFQVAANMATPGDGRYLQCCNLLGHCFMQTGVPELAVKWFTKGLNAPGASSEERLALSYEIGAAYEQAGDLTRALEFFTEVYGISVSYRNVSERLRTLKARLGDQEVASLNKSRSEQLVN